MLAWALSVMPVICPWWENGESTRTTGPFYCLTLRVCEGSFTLVSGVLNEEPIFAGVAGATVSGALEGFVRATAIELPKGLRINVVNPTILKESDAHMGSFFPGVIPVEGWKVGQAYKRAILGAQTGRVYKVD